MYYLDKEQLKIYEILDLNVSPVNTVTASGQVMLKELYFYDKGDIYKRENVNTIVGIWKGWGLDSGSALDLMLEIMVELYKEKRKCAL